MGSRKILDDFTVLKDLNANIAIGNSVHPKIIFLHFFLIKKLIDDLMILLAAFTFPNLTNLIALLTEFFCIFLLGVIKL